MKVGDLIELKPPWVNATGKITKIRQLCTLELDQGILGNTHFIAWEDELIKREGGE